MPALIITTQVPVSVALTNGAGTAVAVYSDAAMSSSVSQPLTVSSSSTVYVAAGPVRVVASDGSSTALLDTVVAVPIAGSVTATVPAPSVPQLANLYGAHTILVSTADNSPVPLTVPEGTVVGRAVGGGVAALTAAQVATLLGNPLTDILDSGEASLNRRVGVTTTQASTQVVALTYWSARRSETVTKIASYTSSTAAGATPSLCRMGLYEVAANGDLTLVASCANDTSLWAATGTRYERNLTAPYAKVAGQRYATALLVVTSAAVPTFVGNNPLDSTVAGLVLGSAPRLSGYVSGTDLPATIAAGSVLSSSRRYYVEVLP